MKPLFRLTAAEAVHEITSRHISCQEYIAACLTHTRRVDPGINAWVCLDDNYALEQAKTIDEKIQSRKPIGQLVGVPIGVKDIFNTYDFPTQMGSPVWKNFTPGNDARVVFQLRQEDAVIPGKTVTAEFAVHTPGPTHNPHRHGYMTGTSSSGSAAAVAAHMVPVAIGTQTAGSIIRPASYCGVYGMKPSFGLLPRTGMLKTTDTLDQVGFFSQSAADLELLFEVMRVHGSNYPISDAALKRDRIKSVAQKRWRVALVTDTLWIWEKAEVYAREAIRLFGKQLDSQKDISLEQISLPALFNQAHRIHETIYNKTLAYYFQGELKRKRLVSKIMQQLVEEGERITLVDYQQALSQQTKLARLCDQLLSRYDVILTLSTGGEALKGLDSVDRPDSCLIWTLCHVPTISVPLFTGPTGLPFGAQIASRRFRDYSLLKFAQRFHKQHVIRI